MSTGGSLEGPWAKLGAVAGTVGTIVAIVIGVAQCSNGDSTNTAAPSPEPTSAPAPTSDKVTPTPIFTDPNSDSAALNRDGTDDSLSDSASSGPTEEYLNDFRVTDHNRDSSTGGWEEGAKDINGEQFGHSIMTYAGCQNDDGGDFWIDLTIGQGWRQLSGTVGLTGDSSAESAGTWRIQDPLTRRELASGSLAAGPGVPVSVDLQGVTRLRLFMNNPNAPKQACGFAKISTRLVWGDMILTK